MQVELLKLPEDSKYLQYIKQFKDRPLKRGPGYEIHHIIPKAIFDYATLPIDESDDNKVKLTYYEHIYAHYLLAQESQDSNSILIFYQMLNFNFSKIKELAKLDSVKVFSEEELQNYARLREQGKQIARQKLSEIGKELSKDPEHRKKISEATKVAMAKLGPEWKQKHQEAMKRFWADPENRKRHSEATKQAMKAKEVQDKIRAPREKHPSYMSQEQRDRLSKERKGKPRDPKAAAACKAGIKIIHDAFLIEKENGFSGNWRDFQKQWRSTYKAKYVNI